MEPTVTDTRRVKDETVGPAAKVSTSTLKPKTKAAKPPKRSKKEQAAAEEEAIAAALEAKGHAPGRRPPKRAAEPEPEEHAIDTLELDPVVRDDAWCGTCGGMLYASPSGDVCRQGHGEPKTLTWDEAALFLYDRGNNSDDAALIMEAESEDVGELFGELDARAPEPELEPEVAPGATDDATRAGAVQSIRAGASLEQMLTFYGKAIGEKKLRALFEEHAPKKAEEAKEPAAKAITEPLPVPVQPRKYLCAELDCENEVAPPLEGYVRFCAACAPPPPPSDMLASDLPAPAPISAEEVIAIDAEAREFTAAVADDARQLQPVFQVGDLVTPVAPFRMGESSGTWMTAVPGARLEVVETHAGVKVRCAHLGRDYWSTVGAEMIRHFTEAREPEWCGHVHRGPVKCDPPTPGNAPGERNIWEQQKSWLELQLSAKPLSAADYERVGRLWVGALIAGVDIQTYAMREREVFAAVRGDILGTHNSG